MKSLKKVDLAAIDNLTHVTPVSCLQAKEFKL